MKAVKGYEVIEQQELKELDAIGYLLEHKKTKAKVVAIETEDENKVFSIGFRTPPKDSTGVAHIVEHTVLCGSKEFPVKDPFIELAKGSLNTFLNAMTYPDKTVYPVASCNDKDFQNLMHVYLDAVFYPNIYKEEKIFKQEGWHYELEDVNGPLTYNGVVFNEMKGAFSSADQLIERKIQQELFPDNPYGFESGGDPVNIPDLTYQDYLDFHGKYYHPSNSYIYLYGDMDMEEKLTWIDEAYLSDYEYLEVDSEITKQAAFEEPKEAVIEYPLSEGETPDNKNYYSYNVVVGDSLDQDLYIAFQVLDYVLVSGIGAPVKQALLDAGIGTEVLSCYEESICQPYFSIVVKNAAADKKEEFLTILKQELQRIVQEGVSQDSLEAGLNSLEFRYREADFGSYPKGLMYGLQIFDSWLYDASKPFIHIQANETFKKLRDKINTGYFEKLIEIYLLQNSHCAVVTALPKAGMATQMEEAEAKRLADHFSTLSEEEKEQLIRETKELEAYQEEPSPKEDLEKIPLLSREDIKKEAAGFSNLEKSIKEIPVLHHDYFTNGIHYINLMFDMKPWLEKYPSYIALLMDSLGSIDTDYHDKLSLSNEILKHAGNVGCSPKIVPNVKNREEYCAYFSYNAKTFVNETAKILDLLLETMQCSHLDDTKRLKEIISERKSSLQMRLISAGHSTAIGRGMSYFSKFGRFDEEFAGISYYRFLCDLEENFEERKDNLTDVLNMLVKLIFTRENLCLDITCSKEDYIEYEKAISNWVDQVPQKAEDVALISPAVERETILKNEGFKTAGQVQYVARVGNYLNKGIEYKGAYRVIRSALSYGYLWNEVRVKGGAYGVMCGFPRSGEAYFVSYRDPKLVETNEVYHSVINYLRDFEADEREMTQYVIGTISSVDTPLNPRAKGNRSQVAYLSQLTEADVQKERDEILGVSVEDIRSCADMVEAFLSDDYICVVGSEEKIKDNSELFELISTL